MTVLAWYAAACGTALLLMGAADVAWTVLSAPAARAARKLASWLGLRAPQSFQDSPRPVKGGDAS